MSEVEKDIATFKVNIETHAALSVVGARTGRDIKKVVKDLVEAWGAEKMIEFRMLQARLETERLNGNYSDSKR